MKYKKDVGKWELWYFRLAAIFVWVVVNIGIMGIVFDTHQENITAGATFFLLIIGSQFTFFLMVKMMEKAEIEE